MSCVSTSSVAHKFSFLCLFDLLKSFLFFFLLIFFSIISKQAHLFWG
jgi:hypothetical protein